MTDHLVRLDNITCAYGALPTLLDVDLTIGVGEFVGVVGPSGAGKTTLLRAVLGAVRPVAGNVSRQSGISIGYVPQVETIDWTFPVTVAECVLMARTRGRIWPWRSAAEREDVDRILDRLGLAPFAARHIGELSGGQQQRVFIARALLGQPELLLLDEPTAGVDVRTRHDILHLLGELNQAGLAVVLTTHDLNGIAAHLPRLVCLNTSVAGDGAPHEVLVADVLEQTYGAPLHVIEHAGMPIVVDRHHADR